MPIPTLFPRFLATYDWKTHHQRLLQARDQGATNFQELLAARDAGQAITDLVLERLLPHADTSYTRETGRWIHVAPVFNKDIKPKFEGSGWQRAEDWPGVAELVLDFVEHCVERPEELGDACREFAEHPLSTGFQAGTLSPILNALRPHNFRILNQKSRKVLNFLTESSHGQSLLEYPTANRALRNLVEELAPTLTVDAPDSPENPDPADLFDIFCHWLVAVEKHPLSDPTVRYWKLSPGEGGREWETWLAGEYVGIGWNELGDLSGLTEQEFQARRDELLAGDEDLTVNALNQVWRFSQISEGDQIVANKGISRVLGIGTAVGPYYFDASAPVYRHRMAVEWHDTPPRKVDQSNWRSTLIGLDKGLFDQLRDAPIVDGDFTIEVEPDTPTAEPAPSSPMEEAQNIILYGPPGTGKTWSTKSRAVTLCLKPDTPLPTAEIDPEFKRLWRQGRIEFVTFHQSFAYEEFVEGIRPVISDGDATDNTVHYRCEPGIFKSIALRAAAEGVQVPRDEITFEQLWQRLVDEVRAKEEDGEHFIVENYKGDPLALMSTRQDNFRALPLSQSGEVVPNAAPLGASKRYNRPIWEQRHNLSHEYSDYSYSAISNIIAEAQGTGGGCHGHLIWAVHFELLRLKDELDPTETSTPLTVEQRISLLQDHLVRGSERSEITLSFEDAPDYVLVIDEINRGNISKILGELITLLEPSKRLTAPDELIVRLPYSKERFAVPPNLHILGTMNTADRSIALMDAALRRRFDFAELPPDPTVIRDHLDASLTAQVFDGKEDFINLVIAVFEAINARIELLFDRDHRLGHSYLMSVSGYEGLRKAFVDQIIPLLQEYFFESWEQLCLVLGCPYDPQGKPQRYDTDAYETPLITAAPLRRREILGIDAQDHTGALRFAVNPRLSTGGVPPADLKAHFLSILTGEFRKKYESREYYQEQR